MQAVPMNRGLGHEIDEVGEAERLMWRPLAGLVGFSDAGEDNGDLSHLEPMVLDQSWSLSCVWQAIMMALFMRGVAQSEEGTGPAIPFPSIMQAWTLAQWQADREMGVPPSRRRATNRGSRISSGLRALREFGICSARRWPFPMDWDSVPKDHRTGEVILDDMPLDVDIASADALLTGDYGAASEDFPRMARRALRQRHFPVVAFDVDEPFLNLEISEWRGLTDPIVGRHCVLVTGWRPGWLKIKNSYGPYWGSDGYCWIPDEYLSSRHARDGAVVTAVPKVAA